MTDVIDLSAWRAAHKNSVLPAEMVDNRPGSKATNPGVDEAEELCLRAISRADRTVRELDDRLKQAGFSVEARVEALERIEQRGLVNEDRIAQRSAEKMAERATGTRLIRQRLKARGLSDESISAAISGLNQDEVELAAKICAEFLNSNSGLDPEVAKRRLLGRLERKGFPADISYHAVKSAFDN